MKNLLLFLRVKIFGSFGIIKIFILAWFHLIDEEIALGYLFEGLDYFFMLLVDLVFNLMPFLLFDFNLFSFIKF